MQCIARRIVLVWVSPTSFNTMSVQHGEKKKKKKRLQRTLSISLVQHYIFLPLHRHKNRYRCLGVVGLSIRAQVYTEAAGCFILHTLLSHCSAGLTPLLNSLCQIIPLMCFWRFWFWLASLPLLCKLPIPHFFFANSKCIQLISCTQSCFQMLRPVHFISHNLNENFICNE